MSQHRAETRHKVAIALDMAPAFGVVAFSVWVVIFVLLAIAHGQWDRVAVVAIFALAGFSLDQGVQWARRELRHDR